MPPLKLQPLVHKHKPPSWLKSIEVARQRVLVALSISHRTSTGLRLGTLAPLLQGCDRDDLVDELLADLVQSGLVRFALTGNGPNEQPIYAITPLGLARVKMMIDSPPTLIGPKDPQAAQRRKASNGSKARPEPSPNAFALDQLFSPSSIGPSEIAES